jgi:NDP-sugar pyrophosphorylase family protein
MKGMVFAAGLGTRLRPLTDSVPKALVELGGVPMLQRVLLRMKAAGSDEVVVNVHHFADKVKEFLVRNDNFGMCIHVSDESTLLLDTGGGVAAAARWLAGDEPILLHNADIFTDIDFADMARAHASSGADATLLVAPRTTSRYLLFDTDMRMHGWTDLRNGAIRPASLAPGAAVADSGAGVSVDSLSRYAFGGVHIISPTLLSNLVSYATILKQDDCGADGNYVPFSITNYYIDVCNSMRIFGYIQPSATRWHDIGTLDKLSAATASLRPSDM